MFVKRDKKEEEEVGNPFHNIEKSTVLQEARIFNETPIHPRKCGLILTKIIYLINQGEQIGSKDATNAFFAMTKLFQCNDAHLRRMVYLTIKEMSKISEDVIIVTSSLTKDMIGKEDQFRGPAIRALCSITDVQMLQSIDRYMKQAIVDKCHSVSSAALVSSLHFMKAGMSDCVKRWTNEIQEAVSSDSVMVQFHALGLLYHVRKHDKLAVTKMVAKFARTPLKSPYAYCMLIRIASRLLEDEDNGVEHPMFDFLESCLRHKSEMVTYEAASAIVNMKHVTTKELVSAVSLLQLYCSSAKPALRFAAVKTLNKISMKHPAAVTQCNVDLENLITDVNRSIATLAITTLLKTGSEGSVDRLMKQISSFMSEISDEFKIVVVNAIRALCLKFPRKHTILMSFLSSMLRDDGGFNYKRAIVDTIIAVIEENSEAKEAGLSHLCEFIEDCEHTVLATRILHLLGREGPRTVQPSKYIRFIYNRVILENAPVRAAAVTAMAKFGAHCESLLPSIIVLLQRCKLDQDDEVRDRATLYVEVLSARQSQLNSMFILNGLQVSVVGLERALVNYNQESHEKPFDIKTVPIATQPVENKPPSDFASAKPAAGARPVASQQDIYAEQLGAIPEFAALGTLFRSSPEPAQLTEAETEYGVHCIKHTFLNYMVLQFNCENTLKDQVLENVTVAIDPADGWSVVKSVAAPLLKFGQPATTYTCLKLPTDPTQVTGTFSCTLKFIVKDCDPVTGETEDDDGYADEYMLEDIEVTVADHVQRVVKTNFSGAWDDLGPENELEDTYALASAKTLQEAVTHVVQFLGMQPCERSDKVGESKSSHTMYLAGLFRGGHEVLLRAKLILMDTVTLQVVVRSTDANASEVIASAIG